MKNVVFKCRVVGCNSSTGQVNGPRTTQRREDVRRERETVRDPGPKDRVWWGWSNRNQVIFL